MKPIKLETESVSIIMPVYNGASTIVQSIESILNQTYKDIRLYIIDDCSTDETSILLQSLYISNDRVELIRNIKNKGVAESRNIGIERSRGKYIAFCDADDLWGETKLEKQLDILESEKVDVICTNYYLIDLEDNIIGSVCSPEIITYKTMLGKNHIGNLTGIYNVKKIGKVYQKKIGHEDYLMWLEILRKTEQAICIQENLAKYRVSKKSLSANKLIAAQWTWNIYRKQLKIPIIPALYFFSQYAVQGLLKKII